MMKLKYMKVGTRISLGFGAVIIILGLLGTWSYLGIGTILKNADQIITGNRLDSTLAQREVDHLNWAKALTELLTNDEIATLTVETDHKKCAFGKWLYGEERLAAEKLVEIANEIDAVILKHLDSGAVDARDLVGLLSHRLGSLMNHLDEKSELWGLCEKVMKQQAQID